MIDRLFLTRKIILYFTALFLFSGCSLTNKQKNISIKPDIKFGQSDNALIQEAPVENISLTAKYKF